MNLSKLPIPALYLIGAVLAFSTLFLAKLAHGTVLFWPLVALAFIPWVVFVDKAWRRMDETAKEAHKFAWFWGGSIGLTIAVVAAELFLIANVDLSSLASLPAGSKLGAARAPAAFFLLGVIFATLCQFAGTLVTWAGWWLSKR